MTKFPRNPNLLIHSVSGHRGRRGRVYLIDNLAVDSAHDAIEICGRKDTQVKLTEQRIELGEVEHALQQSIPPSIDIAAEVVIPEQARDEPTLLAFLSASPGPARTTTSPAKQDISLLQTSLIGVEERILQYLPIYMIPFAFIQLPELPLTASQKVDCKRLWELGMSMNPQVALIVSSGIRMWIVLNSSALKGRVRKLRTIYRISNYREDSGS